MLVGGFNPAHLKKMLVKLDHFPNFRGENKTYLKPPPSIYVFFPNIKPLALRVSSPWPALVVCRLWRQVGRLPRPQRWLIDGADVFRNLGPTHQLRLVVYPISHYLHVGFCWYQVVFCRISEPSTVRCSPLLTGFHTSHPRCISFINNISAY